MLRLTNPECTFKPVNSFNSLDGRRHLDAGAKRVPADHDGDRTPEVGRSDQVPEKRSALFYLTG